VAFKDMITSIKRRFRINRVVFVVNRGMISKENIRQWAQGTTKGDKAKCSAYVFIYA